MELEITTLIENQPDEEGKFQFEHGFSLYIEADGKKILFDTGQSGNFIENAQKLEKDINALDYCILSHGHYDHTGGVMRLLSEITKKPEFIVGEEIFAPKYKTISDNKENDTNIVIEEQETNYKYIGNPFVEDDLIAAGIKVRKVKEDFIKLSENIYVFHNFERHNDFEKRNEKFVIKENNNILPDDFLDEIAIGIKTTKGLVVVVGCSHIGIANILETISRRINTPIYAVIGGTHLVDADNERINSTIDLFKKMNIQLIAVSHCTGEEGMSLIKEEMKGQFINNKTGNRISI